jgi:hypothetical protein
MKRVRLWLRRRARRGLQQHRKPSCTRAAVSVILRLIAFLFLRRTARSRSHGLTRAFRHGVLAHCRLARLNQRPFPIRELHFSFNKLKRARHDVAGVLPRIDAVWISR